MNRRRVGETRTCYLGRACQLKPACLLVSRWEGGLVPHPPTPSPMPICHWYDGEKKGVTNPQTFFKVPCCTIVTNVLIQNTHCNGSRGKLANEFILWAAKIERAKVAEVDCNSKTVPYTIYCWWVDCSPYPGVLGPSGGNGQQCMHWYYFSKLPREAQSPWYNLESLVSF